MEKQPHTNNGNENSKEGTNQQNQDKNKSLPLEAREGGFTSIQEWELANNGGFNSKNDWEKAKKGSFNSYQNWIQAQNEGFETKEDWDDWQELKESGLTDIDLFYESKDIGFYQNNLRKAFLVNLKLAKKGGFNSYLTWKNAQKWNIDTYDEWQLVKELHLQSQEEYELIKEFKKMILGLFEELFPNQEITINRMLEINAEDYKYNQSKTGEKKLVYKNFTRERFEELYESTVKLLVLDNEEYKYSRITKSIIKIPVSKIPSDIEPQTKQDVLNFPCPNCHNSIAKTSLFCQYCGEKIEKCPICQSALLNNSIGSCPNCKTKFHMHHFQEVLKVSGKCPVCKNEVQEHEIVG